MSKVFVAGGTGVIGWRAVRDLVAAGHEVTAIARSPEKAELVRRLGATPVEASLFDRDGLAAAVAGHEVVVNLATHIPPLSAAARPGAWKENDRIRTEGAANLVDAAIAAGAARFVQESITFRYVDSGDRWIDAETAGTTSGSFTEAVAAAEASVARFTESGGTGVVLRFGGFYAPDASHTQAMVSAARAGVAIVAGKPGAYQSMIHADDAAAAVVAALRAPAGVWDVVDDEPLTKRELAKALGGALRIPGSLANVSGQNAKLLAASQRVSNRRFKEATGWAPRYPSVREGFSAVVEALGAGEKRPLLERLVRPSLFLLALTALQVGFWAALAPRSFYDDFPTGGWTWVSPDGPYNEHLVRDVGQLNLGLAVLLLAALWRPDRFLVRVAALASLVVAVPHLAYHAANLDGYGTADKVSSITGLALAVLLPAICVVGAGGVRDRRAARRYGPGEWVRSPSSPPQVPVPSPGG